MDQRITRTDTTVTNKHHSSSVPAMPPNMHVNADASPAALRARLLRAGYVRRWVAWPTGRRHVQSLRMYTAALRCALIRRESQS